MLIYLMKRLAIILHTESRMHRKIEAVIFDARTANIIRKGQCQMYADYMMLECIERGMM